MKWWKCDGCASSCYLAREIPDALVDPDECPWAGDTSWEPYDMTNNRVSAEDFAQLLELDREIENSRKRRDELRVRLGLEKEERR